MSTREKILAAGVGMLFLVALGYVGIKKMYLGKLAGYDSDQARVKKDLDELRHRNQQVARTAGTIKGWTALTYDMDELRASAKVGASLMALVERAGLSPEKLSLQPVRGIRARGAYRELGRTIRVRGKLPNVIDFLYLLEQEPHLHRLDNLSITPVAKTNEIDLQVRYITLVIEAKKTDKLVTDKLPTTAPTDLDSEKRKLFDGIAIRDLFRPYIQKVALLPPPPPTPTPTRIGTRRRTVTPAPAAAAPSPGRFRVVGLPDWSSKQEILVSDKSTGQLRAYKSGDTLGGGTIAMVDYRSLPSPVNPRILSPSRVILRVGPDYWAIELGQVLTEKRRLPREQLPEKIRSLPTPAPGDKVKKNVPAER